MQSSNRKSVSETVCCVSNPSVVSDCSATGEAGDVLRNRRDRRSKRPAGSTQFESANQNLNQPTQRESPQAYHKFVSAFQWLLRNSR
jgi:hypothetical protein